MILQISLSSSILILFVIVIRSALLNKLPKISFLFLWGVALFRLIFPITISSQFSIFTLIQRVINLPALRKISLTSNSGIGGVALAVRTDMTSGQLQMTISPLLVIWLSGMISIALFIVITHLHCRRGYKMALPIENTFIEKWQQEHPTRRIIQIKQSARIASPLTYGIFRPIILLPKSMNFSDECQLQYVLAHEYVHIKRFDVLVKWLFVAGLCIHWFNPIVWIMYILANRDIEISCDEAVIRTLGETSKSAYALTLISLEQKKSNNATLSLGFSKNAIEERITAIMKVKKTSFVVVILTVLLIIGTTTVFATSATADPTNRIKPSYSQMTTNSNEALNVRTPTTDTISLQDDNSIGEHDIPVDGTFLYKNSDGQNFSFNQNVIYTIKIRIVDRGFDYGQGIHVGYIFNGKKTQVFQGQIKKAIDVEFTVPNDGDYSLYIECASSDPLLVSNVLISNFKQKF